MQLFLPIFPIQTTLISPSVGVYKRDGIIQYLVNGLPVYSHGKVHKIVGDRRERIQSKLNKGQSVYSIAKEEGVEEAFLLQSGIHRSHTGFHGTVAHKKS